MRFLEHTFFLHHTCNRMDVCDSVGVSFCDLFLLIRKKSLKRDMLLVAIGQIILVIRFFRCCFWRCCSSTMGEQCSMEQWINNGQKTKSKPQKSRQRNGFTCNKVLLVSQLSIFTYLHFVCNSIVIGGENCRIRFGLCSLCLECRIAQKIAMHPQRKYSFNSIINTKHSIRSVWKKQQS